VNYLSVSNLLIPVLVLQLFEYQTFGEVVESFMETCPDFFINDPTDPNVRYPPTVLQDSENPQRYKQICQRLNNVYRYTTLYDTKSRIPVYSAYYYIERQTKKENVWKIEPQVSMYLMYQIASQTLILQLDDPSLGAEMARENTVPENVRGKKQALHADYSSQKLYTRGHLFPRCYSESQECAIATFTHTNAVPQTQQDNNEWGKKAETQMKKMIKDNCNEGLAHIVTGAVPGDSWMEIKRDNVPVKEGVNIPTHFWTAYCCRGKTSPSSLVSHAWLATRKPEGLEVRKKPVKELENQLTSLYGITEGNTFSVFGGVCQGNDLLHELFSFILEMI
uniref:Endonuclease domain containing 1 n=1 Tax=Astyanax mexicanus TaxID=7994 RepID=A0A8B9J5D4_ASTMX